MKLYHYITKGNSALTDGILSFARNPQADLTYYYRRSGADTHEGIIRWMESCFAGRSRGIRGFTEPIQWTQHSLNLKSFVDNADLFAIDLDALDADGRIEAVYVSPPVTEIPGIKESRDCDEILQKLSGIEEISLSPIDWSVCNDKLGRRFAYIRYYLVIVKDGIIPPRYISQIP